MEVEQDSEGTTERVFNGRGKFKIKGKGTLSVSGKTVIRGGYGGEPRDDR